MLALRVPQETLVGRDSYPPGTSPFRKQRGETLMRTLKSITSILAPILVLFVATVSWAQNQPSTPVKIAILPFTMNTPSDLAYLKDGIRDMLTSRLVWQGKVQIVDRTLTEQAIKASKTSLSPAEAVALAKTLKADWVLFGSVTAMGKAISIDAKMVPVAGSGEPVDLYTQANNLDEVIPRINQFAEDINRKAFGRPTETAQHASEADAASTMNPELLIPQSMVSGSKISYLNPNFIEVTPEGAIRQPGLWSSQPFNTGLIGMDVGDLDGDGRQELVTISYDKLTILQRQANGLKTLGTFTGDKLDHFIWVSLADQNRDGKCEIYLTDMRRRNLFGNTDDKISQGANTERDVSSFVLAYDHGKIQVLAEKQPYFLNAVDFPKRGRVVIGQQPGVDDTFKSEISEMQLQGRNLRPLPALPLPSRCNVFNFAKGDINNDGTDEIVVIDQSNNLLVLNSSGDQLWKANSRYGATTNSIVGKVEDRRYNQVDFFNLPCPIVITDLNKDGIPEIIVNDNLGQGRLLPAGLKYYDKGQITSFSWNQLGLIENWKTTELSGMVTSIRVGDLTHGGIPQLVATLVMAKDFLKLWESRSTIFSYDLNISAGKSTREQ
jgi:TolB-like protein